MHTPTESSRMTAMASAPRRTSRSLVPHTVLSEHAMTRPPNMRPLGSSSRAIASAYMRSPFVYTYSSYLGHNTSAHRHTKCSNLGHNTSAHRYTKCSYLGHNSSAHRHTKCLFPRTSLCGRENPLAAHSSGRMHKPPLTLASSHLHTRVQTLTLTNSLNASQGHWKATQAGPCVCLFSSEVGKLLCWGVA